MTDRLQTWKPSTVENGVSRATFWLMVLLMATFGVVSTGWAGADGFARGYRKGLEHAAEMQHERTTPAWPPADIEIETPELPKSLKEQPQ